MQQCTDPKKISNKKDPREVMVDEREQGRIGNAERYEGGDQTWGE